MNEVKRGRVGRKTSDELSPSARLRRRDARGTPTAGNSGESQRALCPIAVPRAYLRLLVRGRLITCLGG